MCLHGEIPKIILVFFTQSTNTGSFLNEEVDFTNVRTGS